VLLAALDFVTILPIAIFGMFAIGAWFLLEQFSGSTKPRALERLEEYKNPQQRKKRLEEESQQLTTSDAVTRVLSKASPALSAPLQPKSELEINNLKLKLALAGFRNEHAVNMFLSLKFAGLILGLLGSGVTLAALQAFNQKAFMMAFACAGVLFYVPDMVLMFLTSSRKDQIFMGLPDALDLLVVCVEAGLGLDAALRKVSEEMGRTYPVLSEEFRVANLQMQMGKPRSEVWRELGIRSGVDDLQALATILIQAEKFGSSVAGALRVQSDSMRTRRKQIAEEKAAKTAVKLIFPLVIFIFPGIFVVLVGPAGITMVKEMFPLMSK
jgi:tight adherence protein C